MTLLMMFMVTHGLCRFTLLPSFIFVRDDVVDSLRREGSWVRVGGELVILFFPVRFQSEVVGQGRR